MAKQIVMDHTGDTKHDFDIADAKGLAEAEERFKELTGVGFTAAARNEDNTLRLVRNFDPSLPETLFYPRLQGG